MTLLLIQIHSETYIFLSTKVNWEREKRGFISYLSAWGSGRRVCLKMLPRLWVSTFSRSISIQSPPNLFLSCAAIKQWRWKICTSVCCITILLRIQPLQFPSLRSSCIYRAKYCSIYIGASSRPRFLLEPLFLYVSHWWRLLYIIILYIYIYIYIIIFFTFNYLPNFELWMDFISLF